MFPQGKTLHSVFKISYLLSYRCLHLLPYFLMIPFCFLAPKVWKWSIWMFACVRFRNKWNQWVSENQNVWTSPLLWPPNEASSYYPRICSPWWESFIAQHRGISKMILSCLVMLSCTHGGWAPSHKVTEEHFQDKLFSVSDLLYCRLSGNMYDLLDLACITRVKQQAAHFSKESRPVFIASWYFDSWGRGEVLDTASVP